MTRYRRALPVVLLLILAACTPAAVSSPSAEPTATPEPTPSATPDPSLSPTESDEASPEASPSASMIEGAGGFSWPSNDEADALFEDRFDCQNLDDGYQVQFPASWNANAEFGEVPPCSWFAPTEYSGGTPADIPDEVAIVVFVQDDGRDYGDADVLDRQDGTVGATQPAYRATVRFDDEEVCEYVVALGPDIEEGPVLVAGATDARDGDFELSCAVLDRMMQTMEFIGVIQ